MKCEKCGCEWYPRPSPLTEKECHVCADKKEIAKSNPSPQQIYQHIKTDCERREFDVFMDVYIWAHDTPWKNPISNDFLAQIKKDHSDWFKWLCEKGLVKRKMVKKVISSTVEWEKFAGMVVPVNLDDNRQYWQSLNGKKGKLTFEWEEEE